MLFGVVCAVDATGEAVQDGLFSWKRRHFREACDAGEGDAVVSNKRRITRRCAAFDVTTFALRRQDPLHIVLQHVLVARFGEVVLVLHLLVLLNLADVTIVD